MTRPVPGKKDQNNERYLHCQTREFLPLFIGDRNTIVGKKVKVALPENCPIKVVTGFVFW